MSSSEASAQDNNKKQKTSLTCVPSWFQMELKLRSMPKEDIIACVVKSWAEDCFASGDAPPSWKGAFASEVEKFLSGNWVDVNDADMLLGHVLRTQDGKHEIRIPGEEDMDNPEDEDEYENVEISIEYDNLDDYITIGDFRSMIESEGKVEIEDEDGGWGCEECGVSGSTFTLTVQQKGENEYRLKADIGFCCGCHGEPGIVARETIFYY